MPRDLPDALRVIPMVCAGIGVVSTAVYFALWVKQLKVLREIRDRLEKK